jgi:hypothetical protein
MALISAFVIQGCDRASNQMERAETSVIEAERDANISMNELHAEIQIYKLEVEKDITENNLSIAGIKREIQNEDLGDARDAYTVRIEELERTNRNLKRQIDNYSHTTKDNWNEFKSEFSSAMDDLENLLDDFFSTPTTSIN